jgi:hypothetical protein
VHLTNLVRNGQQVRTSGNPHMSVERIGRELGGWPVGGGSRSGVKLDRCETQRPKITRDARCRPAPAQPRCSLSLNGIRRAFPCVIWEALRFNALRKEAVGSRRQSMHSWPLSCGAACELARIGPASECCAWTRYRSAETTQSDYGRHLGAVRMIVLFVPHAAG